jgi:LuxR family maltose regulon positive regulatory protein
LFTWLSLDEKDNEIPRFFSYIVAALQKIDPVIGADVPSILETDTNVPVERLLTSLVNDIAYWIGNHEDFYGQLDNGAKRLVLVLDDYHLISEFNIHESLDFLIDHIPPGMHLVIISRSDPPMPVGRLRVQQTLTEIREADLRFTDGEALSFLNDFMGLNISLEDVRALERRTEGWIAGLQLAALSLRHRPDPHQLILAYSGSHHHLVDYLAHEVLARQSEGVQSFLIRTSILEQLNASLCDAVGSLGRPAPASQHTLDYLEQANLFLVPLDSDRQWYRYHRLFADFLRQRLRETDPEIIPDLFLKASLWYETNGYFDEAMEYALRGDDDIRAARMLDANAEAFLILNAEVDRILRWANRLPESVRAQFPRLCIYHAWALQFEFQLDLVEPTLAMAEAHLADPTSLPEDFSAIDLMGHANAVRAFTALRRFELDQAVTISLAALKVLPWDNSKEVNKLRGPLTLGLGMAYLELGETDKAYQALRSALPMNQQAGNRYAALSCILQLTYLDLGHGALNQVDNATKKGLLWIEEWSKSRDHIRRPARMVALFRLQRGMVQYERNELTQASRNLQRANDYLELVNSFLRLSVYASLVDLHHALGDIDRAFDILRKLKRHSLREDYSASYFPVAAWIAQRNILLSHYESNSSHLLADSMLWAEDAELKSSDLFRFEQELEYLTLAQVLIAQGKVEEAVPLLARLVQSAESSGRCGDMIVRLSLLAIAHHAQNRIDKALAYLARALKMAEPERYIRTFVDLGPDMHDLLQLAARQGIAPRYVATLLAAFPADGRQRLSPAHLGQMSSQYSSSTTQLVEPLNDREQQILGLMSVMYSNREIAEELHLSLNTVKWYARQIYEKLGVASRREAVERVRELGILQSNTL